MIFFPSCAPERPGIPRPEILANSAFLWLLAFMSKRLERMRDNPAGDWTIGEVAAVCREYGILCEAPRGGGSHYKIAHPRLPEKLTIPFKRPIKPVYIRSWSRSLTR